RLGQAYRLAGRLDQALASHRRCLELDPTKTDLMLYVGLELEQQGRTQDAELFFRRILDKVPDYGDALMGLARIAFARDDDATGRAPSRPTARSTSSPPRTRRPRAGSRSSGGDNPSDP